MSDVLPEVVQSEILGRKFKIASTDLTNALWQDDVERIALLAYRAGVEAGVRWIPVSERLPDQDEEGDCVIGYFQYAGGSSMVGPISVHHLLGGTFQGRCTHWMPLPEGPSEPPIVASVMEGK